MSLIFRLAWRNIFRHKGKTWVVGSILFIGAFLMTLGNGLISGMNEGFQANIVRSFTGDALLISDQQESESVLASMSGKTIEAISPYDLLQKHLSQSDVVAAYLPAVAGYVWVLNENGQPIDQYLLGVDFPAYQKFFNHSLNLVEGHFLGPGEKGVLVSADLREQLYDYMGLWILPKGQAMVSSHLSEDAKKDKRLLEKREIVYMGLSQKNSSVDIRVDVAGVFKFKALNKILGFYSILDLNSLRECLGYFTPESNAPLTHAQKTLLTASTNDIESSFDAATAGTSPSQDLSSSFSKSISALATAPQKNKPTSHAAGTYNLVFVKFKPDLSEKVGIQRLRKEITAAQLPVKVVPWSKAIGILGQFSMIMKGALLVVVSFIFFVAVMIMTNTLSMSIMERVSEIGMMRAVGARKSMISGMLLSEITALATFFGGAGIIAGVAFITLFASLHLGTSNEMLQLFFGGDSFQPRLGLSDFMTCIAQLAIVSGVASIYPLFVARKISALDAIVRD